MRNIISRCYDEHRVFFFLHPGQKLSKQPCGNIAAAAIPANTGKCFFNFIDPQHAGTDCFGQLKGFTHIALRFTYILAKQPPNIETHQRNFKKIGCCFCCQTLATTRHTDDHNSLRNIYTELNRLVQIGENLSLSCKPFFQIIKSADVINTFRKRYNLQHPGFLDKLFFFFKDQQFILTVYAAAILVSQVKNLLDLELIQSLKR